MSPLVPQYVVAPPWTYQTPVEERNTPMSCCRYRRSRPSDEPHHRFAGTGTRPGCRWRRSGPPPGWWRAIRRPRTPVGADGRHDTAAAARCRGAGRRVRHQRHRLRGPLEEEDVVVAVGVALAGHQVGGGRPEGHDPPIGADDRVETDAVGPRGRAGRRVRHSVSTPVACSKRKMSLPLASLWPATKSMAVDEKATNAPSALMASSILVPLAVVVALAGVCDTSVTASVARWKRKMSLLPLAAVLRGRGRRWREGNGTGMSPSAPRYVVDPPLLR